MPKRKNPFGEITPLQRKTHVGFEQMATQQEREEVYEKTKALLFQGANPTMDTGKVLGLAVQIPQNGRQICAHNASNVPSCAGDQGQLVFSSNGVLSALPRTNGITGTTIAAGNGSSGSHAAGGRQHTGLLSYFTSSHRVAQGGVQCPGGSGGREVCCGCRRQCVAVGVQRCDHCEKSVCGNCCTQCCVCLSLFCNFCTVLNYDEATVRTFCLNCLPISS